MRLRSLRDVADLALSWVVPPTCPFCEEPVPAGRPDRLCSACVQRLEPLTGPVCERCGLPVVHASALCGACRDRPPAFLRARAWGPYRGALRDAIQLLKYRGRRSLALSLGLRVLDAARRGIDLQDVDWLVPVPLHRGRMEERGFNQAYLLARPLAAATRIPISRDLQRLEGGRQVGLPAATRRDNVANAFHLRPGSAPAYRGSRVLIVDDVVTTGATASAAAQAFLDAGAASVSVVSLARATRDA